MFIVGFLTETSNWILSKEHEQKGFTKRYPRRMIHFRNISDHFQSIEVEIDREEDRNFEKTQERFLVQFYNVYKPVKDTYKRWRSEKRDPPLCSTNDSINISFSSINLFLPIIPRLSFGSRKRNFKKNERCVAYSEKLRLCGLRESYVVLHVRTTAEKYVFFFGKIIFIGTRTILSLSVQG